MCDGYCKEEFLNMFFTFDQVVALTFLFLLKWFRDVKVAGK
jgi:hypothetical protein